MLPMWPKMATHRMPWSRWPHTNWRADAHTAMRIEARHTRQPYFVFHVGEGREVKLCIWVDDETKQWCEYIEPVQPSFRDPYGARTRTGQAKKIDIMPERGIILIDPIEDDETQPVTMEEGSPEFAAWVAEDTLADS